MGDMNTQSLSVRPRPAVLRALGRRELPTPIQIESDSFQLNRIFKHDSWAATGLYSCGDKQIACKFNRQQHIGPLSMKWLGKRLAARESFFLRQLSDLPCVPNHVGPVFFQGKPVEHAVAHDFIAGHPLGHKERVPDEFFPTLENVLNEIHCRSIAYVDLHKRENIIVGDDGRPYLIDFQICFGVRKRRSSVHPMGAGAILNWLQAGDRYHLMKHWSKCRPDTLPEEYSDLDGNRPAWIKVHRLFAQPYRSLRRRLLSRLKVRNSSGRVESEYFAEESIRRKNAA